MIVSAWNDGSSGYGIRIRRADCVRYFPREWKNVRVKIPGEPEVECRLNPTLRTTCPEIRSVAFRNWFEKLGHVKGTQKAWEKGKPPKFHLTPVSGNRFALKVR